METIIHKSETRGKANFGWLDSKHTFSFGHYYDPDRIHFGALRVLNDDIVQPGMGFGTHPHDNMEIVSIPLHGALAHKDSTGNEEVIYSGDVQIMSAGTGLTHSEYNHSKTESVNFLQIWVLPKQRNIKPRYDQKTYPSEKRKNQLKTVVSPNDPDALWINQDASFHLLNLEINHSFQYELNNPENGVYAFLIEGSVKINGVELNKRDGAGFSYTSSLNIESTSDSELLLIEVPMLQLR